MTNWSCCEECGVRNTGWRAVPRYGKWVCPSCAQGVKRERATDALEKRRALLRRLEAEGDNNPGMLRFRHEVERSIEELERRARDQVKEIDGMYTEAETDETAKD